MFASFPTLFLVCLLYAVPKTSGYSYSTDYFEVPLDHFSFAVNKTFTIRYVYNDTFWKRGTGPIFFYTGNEGNIESFAENTGFMWEIAAEFGAMVVFGEHRFYGESVPDGFSYSNLDNSILGYLTIEQTLADYAKLLTWLKKSLNADSSPVIAFGGSYGGQLTAYMRMKYPHIVQGGIAASATLFLNNPVICERHDKVLQSTFNENSPVCAKAVRKSWSAIAKVTKTDQGKAWLTEVWNLCDPLISDDNVTTLTSWLQTMYADIGLANYPYPTNFIRDLPGNPVKTFCELVDKAPVLQTTPPLSQRQVLLMKLLKGINMYYNYTGDEACFDYTNTNDIGPGFSSSDSLSFDYQSCTELIDPQCDDGVQDFFEPYPWNFTQYTEDCRQEFGPDVTPKGELLDLFYGGTNIFAASNIVFSNGLLDPWYGYGVLHNLSDTLLAVVMKDAAHHLDLRASNPRDPPSVIAAREFEKAAIRRWIAEYRDQQERLVKIFPWTMNQN